LAMFAIMGMMFQNGVVGSTGPEMWLPSTAIEEESSAVVPAEEALSAVVTAPSCTMVKGRPLPLRMEGTGGPMPDDYWDPAGLAIGKSPEQLLHWRAVELKHARISMLAVLGWFHVAGGWHPIGDAAARMRVSNDPLINVTQLPIAGAFQLVFTFMCLEWLIKYVCIPPKEAPWDVLGWSPVIRDEDNPGWKEQQVKELNNGRLAMIAILVLIGQDAATGNYGGWIAEPCFGNPWCADVDSWVNVFPPVPYTPGPLYPKGF